MGKIKTVYPLYYMVSLFSFSVIFLFFFFFYRISKIDVDIFCRHVSVLFFVYDVASLVAIVHPKINILVMVVSIHFCFMDTNGYCCLVKISFLVFCRRVILVWYDKRVMTEFLFLSDQFLEHRNGP